MASSRKGGPRQEVVSIRLNEERLDAVERYRERLTEQLGRPLSLAETIFQMIEGRADEIERLTTYDRLVKEPNAELYQVRKTWETAQSLSAAQWVLLAQYAHIGAEEERQIPPLLEPAVPSRTSYVALLNAFEAVYENRREPDSKHVWYYFSNLAGHETELTLSNIDGRARHDTLLKLIASWRDRLTPETGWLAPPQLGRCFFLAIRDEGVPSTTLDRVLAPYWRVLWLLAARGHWTRHDHQPVRGPVTMEDHRRRLEQRIDLPAALVQGDFRVSFAASLGHEFVTTIDFGPTRRGTLLMTRYPELVEFYAMLNGIHDQSWHGRYFLAFKSGADSVAETDDREPMCTVQFHQHDVFFDFTSREWDTLRELFRQAWESPRLTYRLDALRLEYGEHA